MSFSNDVKSELFGAMTDGSAALAECHGMLVGCRSFSFNKIVLQTANREVAEHFVLLLRRCFDVMSHVKEGGSVRPTYTVEVASEADRKKILYKLSYRQDSDIGVDFGRLKTEGNIKDFIRGAFLASGSLADPEKEYRAEYSFRENETAADFFTLLDSQGMNFSMTFRAGKFLVYTKNSNTIEDMLTYIGAGGETLSLIGVKVYKSVRNRLNRQNNFETSNILKTADAAFLQNTAILKLKNAGKLETLPDELSEAAELRLNNPDLSLSDLCKLSKTPITRSGLNHRIKKLMDLAEELD